MVKLPSVFIVSVSIRALLLTFPLGGIKKIYYYVLFLISFFFLEIIINNNRYSDKNLIRSQVIDPSDTLFKRFLNGRISICRGRTWEEKEEEEATAKAARFGDVVQSQAQPSPSTDLDSLPAQILLHRYRYPRHQRHQILVRPEER